MKKFALLLSLLMLSNISVASADIADPGGFYRGPARRIERPQKNQPKVKITEADKQRLQISIDLPAACNYRCEIKDDRTSKTLKTFTKKYSESERKNFTEYFSYKSLKDDNLRLTVEVRFDMKYAETRYGRKHLEGNAETLLKLFTVHIDKKNDRVSIREVR